MKTYTNTSKTTRTLQRDYDDETGAYDYYWLNAAGERRYKNVVMASGAEYSAKSYYGHEVRKGLKPGKFVWRKVDMSGYDRWSTELNPGESIEVPVHKETYAQNASRTGQFNPIRQSPMTR